MATVDINPDAAGTLDDGYTIRNGTSHATNRDNTVGSSTNVNAALSYVGCGQVAFGTTNKFNYRAFQSYDIGSSSIPSGATIDSVKLNLTTNADVTGFTAVTNTGDIHIAKGTQTDTGTGAFNDFDGWVSSGTYEGNVTEYGEFASASATTYEITLNSTAVSDVEDCIDSGYFKLQFIWDGEWVEDYTLTGSGFFLLNGANICAMEDSTTSKRPYIEVEYTSEAGATDNVIIFGTNF